MVAFEVEFVQCDALAISSGQRSALRKASFVDSALSVDWSRRQYACLSCKVMRSSVSMRCSRPSLYLGTTSEETESFLNSEYSVAFPSTLVRIRSVYRSVYTCGIVTLCWCNARPRNRWLYGRRTW